MYPPARPYRQSQEQNIRQGADVPDVHESLGQFCRASRKCLTTVRYSEDRPPVQWTALTGFGCS
jgi:hypothetical protein